MTDGPFPSTLLEKAHGGAYHLVMKSIVIDWDGEHLPPELRKAPPGKYLLEQTGDSGRLTSAQERGLRRALDQLDAGLGMSLAEVLAELRRTARRR